MKWAWKWPKGVPIATQYIFAQFLKNSLIIMLQKSSNWKMKIRWEWESYLIYLHFCFESFRIAWLTLPSVDEDHFQQEQELPRNRNYNIFIYLLFRKPYVSIINTFQYAQLMDWTDYIFITGKFLLLTEFI